MNKIVTVGLGAAAVLVAAFVGAQLIGSPSGRGGSRRPSPSVAAGIPQGPHRLVAEADGGVPITVTITTPLWNVEGCWSDPGQRLGEPRRLLVALQGPGPACAGPTDGAGLVAFQSREYRVYGDACHYQPPPTLLPNTTAATADELVDALARQGHRRVLTSIEEITVDGYAGKKIILKLEDGGIFYGNDFASGTELRSFLSIGLARRNAWPGTARSHARCDQLWIVDVDGTDRRSWSLDAPIRPANSGSGTSSGHRGVIASLSPGLPATEAPRWHVLLGYTSEDVATSCARSSHPATFAKVP